MLTLYATYQEDHKIDQNLFLQLRLNNGGSEGLRAESRTEVPSCQVDNGQGRVQGRMSVGEKLRDQNKYFWKAVGPWPVSYTHLTLPTKRIV